MYLCLKLKGTLRIHLLKMSINEGKEITAGMENFCY